MQIGHNCQKQQVQAGMVEKKIVQQQQPTGKRPKIEWKPVNGTNKVQSGNQKEMPEKNIEQQTTDNARMETRVPWQQVKNKSTAKGQKVINPRQHITVLNYFDTLMNGRQEQRTKEAICSSSGGGGAEMISQNPSKQL